VINNILRYLILLGLFAGALIFLVVIYFRTPSNKDKQELVLDALTMAEARVVIDSSNLNYSEHISNIHAFINIDDPYAILAVQVDVSEATEPARLFSNRWDNVTTSVTAPALDFHITSAAAGIGHWWEFQPASSRDQIWRNNMTGSCAIVQMHDQGYTAYIVLNSKAANISSNLLNMSKQHGIQEDFAGQGEEFGGEWKK
jgi:hypothetical protein